MMADMSDDCDCNRCIAEREVEEFSDSDDSMPDLDEPEDSESEVSSVDRTSTTSPHRQPSPTASTSHSDAFLSSTH